jgi:hypothetical protein
MTLGGIPLARWARRDHPLFPSIEWTKVDGGCYAIIDPADPGFILYLSERAYQVQIRVSVTQDLPLIVLARPGDKKSTIKIPTADETVLSPQESAKMHDRKVFEQITKAVEPARVELVPVSSSGEEPSWYLLSGQEEAETSVTHVPLLSTRPGYDSLNPIFPDTTGPVLTDPEVPDSLDPKKPFTSKNKRIPLYA